MKGLKVDNEQDWEDLSRFLAQNFYKENHRKDAEFLKYGSRGQDQHGIDLISKQADFVVQCKNVQKLEWEDILIELNKTNNYPREIEHYLLLTTAKKNTRVQNKVHSYFHNRNGEFKISKFDVDIVYWEDLKSLEGVPDYLIKSIFPHFSSKNLKNEDEKNIFQLFRDTIPLYISENELTWLENHDFSSAFVETEIYEKFYYLYTEVDRAKKNLLLSTGNRLQLNKVYDLFEVFFIALDDFVQSIRSCTIGKEQDNQNILWIDNKLYPEVDIRRITNDWKHKAKILAELYRDTVLN